MTKDRIFVVETGFWDLNQENTGLETTFEHPELRRHDFKRMGVVKAVGKDCTEVFVGNTVYFISTHATPIEVDGEIGWMIPEDYIDFVKR